MIFNSLNFLIIYPLLFLLYYLIPAQRLKWRNGYLLAVSYLLYVNWNPVCALILFGVTFVTYLFARLLEEGKRGRATIVGGGNFNPSTVARIQVLQLHQ